MKMLSRKATFNSHGQDSSYFLGWEEYEKNPYDEVRNPNGIIQMGLAENQVSFDLLEAWLNNNPDAACFKRDGESIFRDLSLFQDYHGLPAFKNMEPPKMCYSQHNPSAKYWEWWRDDGSIPDVDVPTIDWTGPRGQLWGTGNMSICGPIRNQLRCSCCWAIVTTSLISARRALEYKNSEYMSYSYQQLIDCCKRNPTAQESDGRGCYLYTLRKALDWVVKNGILEEARLPFIEGKNPDCLTLPQDSFHIKGYRILNDIDEILVALEHSPVGAGLDVYQDLEVLKRDALYAGPSSPRSIYRGVHAVMVIGSGVEDDGKKYLLIQSSYGTEWGTYGIAKVDIGVKHKVGDKPARLLVSRAVVPVLFPEEG